MIVGLGNPGRRYAHTRHNIGFDTVDALAKRLDASSRRERFQAEIVEATDDQARLVLVKPLTMMNRSGQAVAQLARWYRCEPEQLLVVYDDLDLPFGRLRLRRGGGAGGHNGVSSVIQQLGVSDFHRLRIGIGRPPSGNAVGYVLSRFSAEEAQRVPEIIDQACDAILCWRRDGIEQAMNVYNRESR